MPHELTYVNSKKKKNHEQTKQKETNWWVREGTGAGV